MTTNPHFVGVYALLDLKREIESYVDCMRDGYPPEIYDKRKARLKEAFVTAAANMKNITWPPVIPDNTEAPQENKAPKDQPKQESTDPFLQMVMKVTED